VSSHRQSGLTLVIVLVMLVVVSLLVASAIRFGNINLKISGNVQSETEATAAAQVALESTVKTMISTSNISTIAANPNYSVSTGGQTYTVNVSKPACMFTKNINTASLDPTKAADQACFEGTDVEKQLLATGALSTTPSACKDQQWDVAAAVNDTKSGTSVNLLQGVSLRVGAEVQCP
jgi:type IV pilus assembly protein PilX